MSPDLPELAWPVYRRLAAKKLIPASYFDKPPAKFVQLVVQIVQLESPIHIDVIIERLAEFGEVAERDRRLGRIASGAAYLAGQNHLISERDEVWWLSVDKPAQARDRRSAAGRAGEHRYISDFEILDGVQKVISFCPTRTVGEWTEITSRSFGFDELNPSFGRVIAEQIEAATA